MAVVDLEAKILAPPESGLVISCDQPETIGMDRLFAVRGAFEIFQQDCVVVDAGTALTVDALSVRIGSPYFLGGAIAPGPHVAARALASSTAHLFEVEPDPEAPALGRDSREAICAGISRGFIGAARELVSAVAREAELKSPVLVVTGGARDFLTSIAALEGGERCEIPDLVQVGLLAAGRAELGLSTWKIDRSE